MPDMRALQMLDQLSLLRPKPREATLSDLMTPVNDTRLSPLDVESQGGLPPSDFQTKEIIRKFNDPLPANILENLQVFRADPRPLNAHSAYKIYVPPEMDEAQAERFIDRIHRQFPHKSIQSQPGKDEDGKFVTIYLYEPPNRPGPNEAGV